MNKDISNKYEVGECPSEEFGDEKERFHFPIPQNAQEPSALMISFASIVIWGIFTWVSVVLFYWVPIYSQISVGILVFSCVCFLLSFIEPFIDKYQSLSLVLTSLIWVAITGGLITICGCAAYTFGSGKRTNYSAAIPFVSAWLIVALIMVGVYSYFYMNQDKHVEWLEKLQAYDTSALTQFGMVYGVIAIGPAVISLFHGGILNICWILLAAAFAAVLPAMVVDALYGAIWVRKHPYSSDKPSEYDLEVDDDDLDDESYLTDKEE